MVTAIKGWVREAISKVAEVNPVTVLPPTELDNLAVPFYEMAAIDEYSGKLRDAAIVPLRDCRTGKTKFQNGDVLFAKITPCVQNRKSALVNGLPGNFACGSSEFYVLRPGKRVMPEYLFYFIRQDPVIHAAVESFIGTSGRQRVPRTFWDRLEIPLPPLPVQERIVQILQKADEIRQKRKQALELAEAIRRTVFYDMFGDVNPNSGRWPTGPLNDLLNPEIERVNPAKAFPNQEFTYIEIAGIRDFRIAETNRLLGRDAPSRARQVVRAGDILYSMTRPNLRNIAAVPEELDGAICTTGFAVLRPRMPQDGPFIFEIVKSDYFTQAMSQLAASKSLYPAVDEPTIRHFQVIHPPAPLRTHFGSVANQLDSTATELRTSLLVAERTFASLLSRAFTGELTAEWEEANAEWIAQQQELHERLPQLLILALLAEKAKRASRTAAVVLVTALMKYVFLLQMEGSASRRRLYHFVPYHYGPFAKELYSDLEKLQEEGLVRVDNDAEEEKTKITLTDPARIDAALAVLPDELKQDVATIIETYGDLDHNALLNAVYEKYPTYARKSRLKQKGRSSK
ncbi:Type I restriction-modification system, specificity subunit S [Candidatus Sumerlaea chitinivorans]|uniref:Type I restriction-modification system, specificity subunit S n=1 Tax=Sumerlaea chitinivorans TaxID=2250252 RepID=A0A2Z4Y7P3_SUMC1|nr:Type I restriction-modification system, specificity subunit S [Candidatus Sumerlaea chitinivorans]